MRRREFVVLVGVAAAWPRTAGAQQPAKRAIGFLRAGQPPKSWVEGFQQGLRERGYVDGQNVVVELRFTDGSADQLPLLAEELVRLKVDVIVASAAPAALAAKKATTSVPIVFAVSNPIEMGLVPNLAHPGGNITGLAVNSADLGGKRLERLENFRGHKITCKSGATHTAACRGSLPCWFEHDVVPMGGTLGASTGRTDGGTIGQTVGGQIGRRSIALEHTASGLPLMQVHLQAAKAAEDGKIE